MKKLNLFILLCMVCFHFSFSQNESKNSFIKPGIGIGFGFFYPTEINDYIHKDLSGYITTNEEMYLNLFIRGSLGIQFNKYFVLEPLIETAFAPKIIVGIDRTYLFGRVSPGLIANFHLPFGSGKHSFFLGGGVLYHYMWFEDYSGSTIGPAVQGGISLNFGRILNPEVFFGINYADATGNSSLDNSKLDLNYTDFHMGLRLNFKL